MTVAERRSNRRPSRRSRSMRLMRIALANFRNYATLEFEPAPGLNVVRRSERARKEQLARGDRDARHRQVVSHVARRRRRALTAPSARSSRGEARVSAGDDRARVHDRQRRRRHAQDVHAQRTRRALRGLSRGAAGRHVRAGRLATRRRRAEPAPGVPQRGARRKPTRATTASSRATARRCSRRTRCCAGRDRADRASCSRSTTRLWSKRHATSMLARERFVARARRAAHACTRAVRGRRETLEVAYDPNVRVRERHRGRGGARRSTARLRDVAERERARKAALAGPHRDDLALTLDGRSLAAYGSQGQQRTAVLALKVAEYAVAARRGPAKRRCSCSTTSSRSSTKSVRRRSWRASASTSRLSSRRRTCRRACRRALAFRRSAAAASRPRRRRAETPRRGARRVAPAQSAAPGRSARAAGRRLGRHRRRRGRAELASGADCRRHARVVTRSSAWSQQLSFFAERIVRGRRAPGSRARPSSGCGFASDTLPRRTRAGPQRRPRRRSFRAVAPRRRRPQSAAEAIARFRASVDERKRAKRAAGWKECRAAEHRSRLAAKRSASRVRTRAARRLDADGGAAALRSAVARLRRNGGAGRRAYRRDYESIRGAPATRWWETLARARASKRLSRDGRERWIASSYVLLKSKLPPEAIEPATVRSVLGDELHEFDLRNGTADENRMSSNYTGEQIEVLGARGRAQAPGHVHRQHRRARAASAGVRSGRQRRRRSAGRVRQERARRSSTRTARARSRTTVAASRSTSTPRKSCRRSRS